MPHKPGHKKKNELPFADKNRQARESGDKTPRSNITGRDLSVQGTIDQRRMGAGQQLEFFQRQLTEGKFADPVEESELKEAIKRSQERANIANAFTPESFLAQFGATPAGEEEGSVLGDIGKGFGITKDIVTGEFFQGEDLELTAFIVPFPIGSPGGRVTGGLAGVTKRVPGQDPRIIINQSVSAHVTSLSGKQLPRGTQQYQKIFEPKIGQPGKTGVNKLFEGSGIARRQGREIDPLTGNRFPANTKSTAQTKSWLAKLGFTGIGIGLVYSAFGTYPWASHNNREATDTLTFGMRKALDAEDIEQYDILAAEFDLMVETMPNAWAQLPGKNVVDSSIKGINNAILVKNSMDSQRAKLERR